jgi:hypothetical protein
MDKALEIIMVAVILIIASVVIITLLQGQSGDFGEFSKNRTEAGDCGLAELRFQRAISCEDSSAGDIKPGGARSIRSTYSSQCAWAEDATKAYNAVC